MAKYPLHEKAVAYLLSQQGVHESPWGSNRGPIQRAFPRGGVDYYEDHDFLAGHGYPWCVTTWLTAWAVAGKPIPYKTASVYAMLNWARGAGWAVSARNLVPGDGVAFNIGSGHWGTFLRWEGDMIVTIDGNTSDQVAIRKRPHHQVAGGVHVPEVAAKPVKPLPEPFWVITTSENGHKKMVFTKFATEKKVRGMLPKLLAKYGKNGLTIKRGGVRKKPK